MSVGGCCRNPERGGVHRSRAGREEDGGPGGNTAQILRGGSPPGIKDQTCFFERHVLLTQFLTIHCLGPATPGPKSRASNAGITLRARGSPEAGVL